MLWLFILLGVLVIFAALLIVLYHIAFYVKPKRLTVPLSMPPASLEKRMKDSDMKYTLGLVREIIELPHEKVFLRSFDGLKLAGRYYDFVPGAPLAILCHGYRGMSAADFRGIFQQVRSLGLNILLISERSHWESEGSAITLGVKEKWDIKAWADYAAERFPGTPIVLYGVSMGAASVMMSTALGLPASVKCIVEDCGFTTPDAIMRKVIKGLKLSFLYPAVRLTARIFGGFSLDEPGAVEAIRHTDLPILFIHGEEDDFVPCRMSRELYEAAAGEKRIFTFPGAAHLHSCLVDEPRYLGILSDFFNDYLRN